MTRNSIFYLLPPLILAVVSAESLPTPSLAVLHLERVFEAHPKTQAATATLTEARKQLRDEYKAQANELKKVLQRHQEFIRAGKRKEAEECLKEANVLERTIATLKTTQERDLKEQFLAAKTEILNEIQAAIEAFNHDGRYALILDISTLSNRHGLSPILHAPGAEDITTRLIQRFQPKATPIE